MGMGLEELESAARQFASAFDPALVSPREAERVLASATLIRNVFDGVCMLASARAAESGQWRRDGARTEAEWVALKLGVGDRDAAAVLEVGRTVASGEYPAMSEALRSGRLSADQAAAVASGAAPPPPKAIVRIDHEALLRGSLEGGETSEIAGIGPVPVSVVREWTGATSSSQRS